MGVRRCLRVLVQVWALVAVERWSCDLSPSEGGGTGMGRHRRLKVVVRKWALVAS